MMPNSGSTEFMALQKANRTAKELIRHLATRLRLHAIVDRVRKAKGERLEHLQGESRAHRFSKVYDKGLWTLGRPDVPTSGPGSTLAATRHVRENLPDVLHSIKCRTLVDVGCGDLTWMSSIELAVDYIGVDVVASVIQRNAARYASERRRFLCLDVAADELPEGDTILCRDILFHLSFFDIRALLQNLGRKPRRWLIATTDTTTWFNADIRSGDYRMLDLRRRPFRFPAPDLVIDDSEKVEGRQLGIWRFERLPLSLNRGDAEAMALTPDFVSRPQQ